MNKKVKKTVVANIIPPVKTASLEMKPKYGEKITIHMTTITLVVV